MNKLAVFLKSPSARSFAIKTLSKRNLSYENHSGKAFKDMSRHELLAHINFLKKKKDPSLRLESPEKRMKRLSK